MKTNPSRWKRLPGNFDKLNIKTLYYADNALGIPLINRAVRVPKWLAPYKTRFRSRKELDLSGGAYHFFLPPEQFKCVWERPDEALKSIKRLSTVLSPAFPLCGPLPQQILATYKNRWCGARWQSRGYVVIPSISWNGPESYEFAFAGVTKGSVVAITAQNWQEHPAGFLAMIETLNPTRVLCFGNPQIMMPEVVSYPSHFHLKLVKAVNSHENQKQR